MRGLSEHFMRDLTHEQGALREILDYVQGDDTLSLEIRENRIHIYYRGGRVYEIEAQDKSGYKFAFDENYFTDRSGKDSRMMAMGGALLRDQKYLEAIPFIKASIDQHRIYIDRRYEKDVQQQTVYENNRSPIANETDYYITDFEYNMATGGQLDLVALKWKNKRFLNAGLCMIEVKLGKEQIDKTGSSDITKHLDDMLRFFDDSERVEALKRESLVLFDQKQKLGLLDMRDRGGKRNTKLPEALTEKPQYMLLLANYKPNSKYLLNALNKNKERILGIAQFDFVIASSSFTGYGLYEDKVMHVRDFMGW